jgi:hypothetical protein
MAGSVRHGQGARELVRGGSRGNRAANRNDKPRQWRKKFNLENLSPLPGLLSLMVAMIRTTYIIEIIL